MNSIVDYKVCESKTPEALELEVSKLFVQGWQPLGGISVVTLSVQIDYSFKFAYYQAMVKYRDYEQMLEDI